MQELLDFVSYSIENQKKLEQQPEHEILCIKMDEGKRSNHIGRNKSDDFYSTLAIPDHAKHLVLEPNPDSVLSSSFIVQFIDNISKNHPNVQYIGVINPFGSQFSSELSRAMDRFKIRKSVD